MTIQFCQKRMENKCQRENNDIPNNKVYGIEFKPAKPKPWNLLNGKIINKDTICLHEFAKAHWVFWLFKSKIDNFI